MLPYPGDPIFFNSQLFTNNLLMCKISSPKTLSTHLEECDLPHLHQLGHPQLQSHLCLYHPLDLWHQKWPVKFGVKNTYFLSTLTCSFSTAKLLSASPTCFHWSPPISGHTSASPTWFLWSASAWVHASPGPWSAPTETWLHSPLLPVIHKGKY